MTGAWQILHEAGVPLAGARRGDSPAPEAAAAAVLEVVDGLLTSRERDALAAFIAAWRQHWPTSFAASFAADAARLANWATHACDDHGRFLKLRRIAIANLATRL